MTPATNHLSMETIQRLCEGTLSDLEQCFAEDHLAECQDCEGVFNRMDALLYRGFSAEAHAAAIRREVRASDPLVIALRRAAEQLGRDAAAIARRWLDSASAVWGAAPVPLYGTAGALAVRGAEEAEPLRVAIEPGTVRCRVRVAQSRRDIEVELGGDRSPQAALLFDPDSESILAVQAFATSGGVHVARFERIPRGEYFLALSPF